MMRAATPKQPYAIDAEWIFSSPGNMDPESFRSIEIESGFIRAVEPQGGRRTGFGKAVFPSLVNAHDHGRGLRSAAFGAADAPLEVWIPSLAMLPEVDLYTCAVVAFGRLALSGVSAISHVHIPGGGDTVAEAEAVARAARDVGVRIAYALPVVDTNAFVYGGPEAICSCHRPDDWAMVCGWADHSVPAIVQMDEIDAVAEACESPIFNVQYGPAGPQWVTETGLENLAERSDNDGRRVHMHFLESPVQRKWSDTHYPGGLLAYLDRIGLLSDRLTLAHCVWLTDAEIALLAERDVTAVLNTSSNLRLRSGIAPATKMAKVGLRFGFGLDGLAFNDDEDALFELRLLSALHAARGLDGDGLSLGNVWQAATEHGRFTIDGTQSGSGLYPGRDGDLMVLDVAAMIEDGVLGQCNPLEVSMTRANRSHMTDLYVAGRQVVADGRLLGVDIDAAETELLGMARAAIASSGPSNSLLQRHLNAVWDHYRSGGHLARRDDGTGERT